MKPFIAIVHKETASAYGVTFPDAPGCFSAADEVDDLFSAAAEALELWAEGLAEDGMDIPAARDFTTLQADPEWKGAFAGADFLIAVPPPHRAASRRAA